MQTELRDVSREAGSWSYALIWLHYGCEWSCQRNSLLLTLIRCWGVSILWLRIAPSCSWEQWTISICYSGRNQVYLMLTWSCPISQFLDWLWIECVEIDMPFVEKLGLWGFMTVTLSSWRCVRRNGRAGVLQFPALRKAAYSTSKWSGKPNSNPWAKYFYLDWVKRINENTAIEAQGHLQLAAERGASQRISKDTRHSGQRWLRKLPDDNANHSLRVSTQQCLAFSKGNAPAHLLRRLFFDIPIIGFRLGNIFENIQFLDQQPRDPLLDLQPFFGKAETLRTRYHFEISKKIPRHCAVKRIMRRILMPR